MTGFQPGGASSTQGVGTAEPAACSTSPAVPIQAATVVVVRARPATPPATGTRERFDVLLLQRNPVLAAYGGHWVFPGGHVDVAERRFAGDASETGSPEAALGAARLAAAREVAEESGLSVEPERLLPLAHWTTPEELPRRFAVWFFLTETGPDAVAVPDGRETVDHVWLTPREALERRAEGRLPLAPPTFVTLCQLAEWADESLGTLRGRLLARAPVHFAPRRVDVPGGRISLLEGDAGYAAREPSHLGARHRVVMLDTGWRYER